MDYHHSAGAAQFPDLARTVKIATRYNPGAMWGNYMLEVVRMLIISGNGWMIPKDVHCMTMSPVLWACYKTGSVDAVAPISGC